MGETTSDDGKENIEKISSDSRNHVEDTSSDIKSEDNMIKFSPFKVESKLTLIESPNKIQKSEVSLSIQGSKNRMETSCKFEDYPSSATLRTLLFNQSSSQFKIFSSIPTLCNFDKRCCYGTCFF